METLLQIKCDLLSFFPFAHKHSHHRIDFCLILLNIVLFITSGDILSVKTGM